MPNDARSTRRHTIVKTEAEWVANDIAALRAEYIEGEISVQEFECGLDDVFGINGGIGHARHCMIDLPSGACTCDIKPRHDRSHRSWVTWIEGREYCYACNEWEPNR